jgi:hypothetical protein
VSKEIDRMQKLDARAEHVAAARRALALRRAAQFPSLPPDRRYGQGRHASVTEPAAADKSAFCQDWQGVTNHENAQAVRDARNRGRTLGSANKEL